MARRGGRAISGPFRNWRSAMTEPKLTRRHALLAGAALPFAPALLSRPAHAAAEMKGSAFAPYNRFKLGGFEVTALLAGTRAVEGPTEIFGLNATPDEFAALSQREFHPDRQGAVLLHADAGEYRGRAGAVRHRRWPPKAITARAGRGGLHPGPGRCGRDHPHARRSYRRSGGRGRADLRQCALRHRRGRAQLLVGGRERGLRGEREAR